MDEKIEIRSVAEICAGRSHVEMIKNGENDDFKGFATKPINNTHSWGIYGGFQLVIRNADGYVNGTRLIAEATIFENTLRKQKNMMPLKEHLIPDWCRNETTILLVDTLKQNMGNPMLKLVDRVKGKTRVGEEMILGSYIHPRLVNSLATWVSPSYALIVGDLMNQHHLKSKLSAEQKRIRELEGEKKNHLDIIHELRDMYNSVSEKFQVTIGQNEQLLTEMKIVSSSNQKLHNKLDTTNNFLRSVARDIRVETEPGNDHSLVICRIAPAPVTDGNFEYKAIRVLNETFDDRIRQAEKIYGSAFQVLRTFKTPNPIQVWKKIKSSCAGIVCEVRSTNFNFAGTEKRLLARIKKIVAGSVARVKTVVDN